MTYFAEKLQRAVQPNRKLAQAVHLASITVRYASPQAFEREMERRRRVAVSAVRRG